MRVTCTSDNRALILRIMEEELGEQPIYHPLPDFSYSAGGYELLRSGEIRTERTEPALFQKLAGLGLCDYACPPEDTEESFVYPVGTEGAVMMMNLISMISARQNLLNQVLEKKHAFFISDRLMKDLLAHPQTERDGFLQALYGREEEIRGVRFSMHYVALSGFRVCREEETGIFRQLADHMVQAARSRQWTKPFFPNVRNKKYAFKVWLYALGMAGDAYEEARQTMLSRLPGRADRRAIPRRKEG